MKNLKSLLGNLWNSKKDSYSKCEHPILQKTIDYIKHKHIQLNTKIEKGYYNVKEIDIHLQRRRTEFLMKKVYSLS